MTWLAGQILTADDLNAYESAWASWTPTLTAITQGNGTIVAKYKQIGKTVHFRFRFTYGSSGSAVGTNPSFTLPVAAASDIVTGIHFPGDVKIRDSSLATSGTGGMELSSSTTCIIYQLNATPRYASITVSSPWTWANGDELICAATYEAA